MQELFVSWQPEMFMRYDNLPDDILWVKSGCWPSAVETLEQEQARL